MKNVFVKSYVELQKIVLKKKFPCFSTYEGGFEVSPRYFKDLVH
jgi:hypothetical protein